MRAIFAPSPAAASPIGDGRAPNRHTVGKIESRLRRVNDAELWLLARVLGCPVADLLPRNARAVTPVLRQGED